MIESARMNWRNKWAFWATVVTVIALISIPSIEWVSALRDYRRFLSGWEPAPLKSTVTSFTPHDRGRAEPVLTSVEFRHKAPKAKSVELVGDFNAWKPGLIKMKRGDGGLWTISIPVLEGRHKYLFLVDGEPTVDERADTADGPQGRRVSVRSVK
jgi:1,4-alpha-glucan branching enzyme